tara:strand:+ start:1066 stop:1308 length:243 start_codon:yes stop_codon:yes gene_type:complete
MGNFSKKHSTKFNRSLSPDFLTVNSMVNICSAHDSIYGLEIYKDCPFESSDIMQIMVNHPKINFGEMTEEKFKQFLKENY